jgi:hypothetical protein
MTCPAPLVCVNGECVDDPCRYIRCPEGYDCVDGTCYEEGFNPDPAADAGENEEEDAGAGQQIMATGAGGCAACSLSGPRDGASSLAVFLLLLAAGVILLIRKKESDGKGGRP